MTRALALPAGLIALALGGCGHLHLPGDGPFRSRAQTDAVADTRVDPVQTRHPVASGTAPPCKFGGKRCPPWERAWPADVGVSPADKVTDAGVIKPAPATAR